MSAREPAWRRYLRFWGSRVDDDVDDELAFHIRMRTEDYLVRGLDPQAARAAAVGRLGRVDDTRSACLTIGHRRRRRMTRTQLVDAFAQDLRYAMRTLRRHIGWTAVAVLTLAIGIGASTAVFGVVNSLILHPLPYRDGDRVMMVWRVDPKAGVMMSGDDELVDAWRNDARSVEAIEAYHGSEMTMTGRGDPATVQVAAVRSTFLGFTGFAPLLGRGFLAEESRAGGSHVAMLSEELWRTRYGASRDVLGQRLTLNDQLYTIVGVTPARLRIPALIGDTKTDIWLALGADSLRFSHAAVARLRPGFSPEAAAKELDSIVVRRGIRVSAGTRQYQTKLVPPGDMVGFRSSLFLLSGAVALLLAVACANVAHLLLARGATRERELAIRVALGAGRARLARQLLTESSVLAAMGCVAGTLIGFASIRVLLALRPPAMAQLANADFDVRSFAAALAASVVTGLVFGCTAALHAIRRSGHDALRTVAPSTGASQRTHRLRSFLVVTEMALSAMLLVGAALVVRSVSNLGRVDPGFDSRNLYAMTLALPRSRYPSSAERFAFAEGVLRGARSMPGVRAATLAHGVPPQAGGFMMTDLEGQGSALTEKPRFFAYNTVPPAFFSTVGIPLIAGHAFDDGSAARHEAIINEGLAKKLWPGQGAVGRRVRLGNNAKDDGWSTVIGVAGDVPTRGLTSDRDEPLLYVPLDRKELPAAMSVVLRVQSGTDPVAPLRAMAKQMDPRLVPPVIRTVDDMLADGVASYRFTMTLLAAFAMLSVLLSAIGLYGVIAYVVTQRQREIGVRIALGATPRHIARTIVARALTLSTIGLVAGLGAATWGTKLIQSSLYGVSGTDPVSYAAAGVLLLAVSVLACALPMRRAMSVDPAIAMRGD